jgi:hypothetical protein
VKLGEQRAVGLDALPQPLDALGIAGLEVLDGVHDRPREPPAIDVASGEAAMLHDLAGKDVTVQVLDGLDQPALVDARHVDDLGLHAPLDGVGQGIDRLDRVLAIGRQVSAGGDGWPE